MQKLGCIAEMSVSLFELPGKQPQPFPTPIRTSAQSDTRGGVGVGVRVDRAINNPAPDQTTARKEGLVQTNKSQRNGIDCAWRSWQLRMIY